MELKKYQKRVIADLKRYCELLNSTNSVIKAYSELWNEKNVIVGFGGLPSYNNTIVGTPHVCFKVPTGGGKTFLACNALRTIFNNLPSSKVKVVVWLVPSEAILSQTLKTLSNPAHPYRQKIEADFNGRVQVYGKQQVLDGQQFNLTTVTEQLSIIVMSFDSFRIKNKEGRKVYQENGNLQQLAKYNPTPETLIDGVDETAMIQRLNQLSPVVIVDESHHTAGELSVEMLKNLNPCFILDLTATPRKNSNIISYVDAAKLKAENMVKLPVIVYNRPSQEEVILDAIDLRNKLDDIAALNDKDNYIRPIILFQAQPKIAENKETFDKLKERLIDIGIPKEEIAIKTAEINELKNVELLSPDCKIKYIITVNALKEGWDCPFAYILATLANKTSVVDVEQILGRILRLPHTNRQTSKFLNLSYVLTCSNDFRSTIKKVVKGLNDAGFSSVDCRAEESEDTPITPSIVQEQISLPQKCAADLFDPDTVKQIMETRLQESDDSIVKEMLSSANDKSDAYESALAETLVAPNGDLPLEVKSQMNVYLIEEEFKDEALALRLPQFFIRPKQSIFSLIDEDHTELLTKNDLSSGFTLKDKSVEIDFSTAADDVVEIDVDKSERPRYKYMTKADNEYFKGLMQSLPPESRKKHCKLQIRNSLEKIDNVSGSDLTAYLDRVIENMNNNELAYMEKNVFGIAKKIRDKIEGLLAAYRKEQFTKLIETGKILCKPSYQLKIEINPSNASSLLSSSLYTAEQEVNGFESEVIAKIASLTNIKWWHRNIERSEFCINGYINHYPDFIVYTKNGVVVMVETKGTFYTSTDDSREKADLGKIWQHKAGDKFRYYMVSGEEVESNADSISLNKFMEIIKEL